MIRPVHALLAALALFRVGYFLWYREALPFWDAPIGDGEVYADAAAAMADGDWLDPAMGYRPFLYPLWLGALSALSGSSAAVVYVLQGIVGLATVYLVHGVGERLWGPRAGLTAAVLCGLYGPLASAETKLLDGALSTFLHVASLAMLLAARRLRGFALAGLLLGLGAVARPPLWLFAGLALGWAAWSSRRAAAAVAVGAAIAVLPFCAWNLAASGRFTPLPRNGAATFYAGNHAGATGAYRVPPGLSGEATRQEAEEARLGASGWALGWRFIRDHPGDAATLWAAKLYRFALADEAPLEHDHAHEREAVPLLHALFVPFSLLFTAGVLGLLLRRERGVGLLAASVAVQVATALAFFVASRYRLLAVPALALLAAGGAEALWAQARRGRRRSAVAAALAVAAAALALAFNPLDAPAARSAVAEFNVAYGWERRADPTRAAAHYQAAVAANPRMHEAWLHLGNLAARRGDLAEAQRQYQVAMLLRPADPRTLTNLAITHLRETPPRTLIALAHLERAAALAPDDPETSFHVGNARKAGGDLAGAALAYARATALAPGFAEAWNNLATALWAAAETVRPPRWDLLARAADALGTALSLGNAQAPRNLVAMARRYRLRP